jgi:transposase
VRHLDLVAYLVHACVQKGVRMQRTPGTTIAEREQYWTTIINEARAYPPGVSAYLRANNISKANYYQWFRRLRKSHPEWQDLSNNIHGLKPRTRRPRRVRPETEVSEMPSRRKFSQVEKNRILKETDSAARGEVAAVLRREGIYASHLQKWRTERELSALASAEKRAQQVNPLASEIKKLKTQNQRLEKRLDQANKIIELQKKVSEILGVRLQEIDEDD